MSKDNFKKQKRLTQEEIDAIDNYGKPLKPQPELPSGGMGGKKGGVVKKKIIKAQIGKYMNEDKQKEKYRKRLQEYQAQQEVSRMPKPRFDEGYISDADREYAMRMRPMENLAETLSPTEGYVSEAERRMMQDNMPEMKKGGKVKMHKMPGGKMMKDSDMKKKKKMGGGMMQDSMGYKKGGTVRGGRSEIKGTRPAKLY